MCGSARDRGIHGMISRRAFVTTTSSAITTPGTDSGLRLGAALEQAALDQQPVDARTAHGRCHCNPSPEGKVAAEAGRVGSIPQEIAINVPTRNPRAGVRRGASAIPLG